MNKHQKYETVIGLEVHIQLLTQSKAYSPESTEYGSPPNTNIGPISLGHPGTLPKVNKKVIEHAVRLGLAVNATIREENQYARKNYFYADLPKGYQITQDKTPICTGGAIPIKNDDGSLKYIKLTRIHMEEDAGKSMHDVDPYDTLIDLNRAGVALLEIVSEPDIKTGDEAGKYLTEVRKLVRYLQICDGNMEEGSMRCDANISVMLKGATVFGNKVEVKNMNSIRNVQRAIEYEVNRQIEAVENGERIAQETRSFDAATGKTASMRTKEDANDYRYFPEPDLQPVIVSQEYIEDVRKTMPLLPAQLYDQFTKSLHLSDYDANFLTESRELATYFQELIRFVHNPKSGANWMMGPIKSYLNLQGLTISDFTLSPERLATMVNLVDDGKVSHTAAVQVIFPAMLQSTEKTPMQLAEEANLLQDSDDESLMPFIKQAIEKYPQKVIEYQQGKVGLLGLFVGEVMKLSKGKADPKLTNQLMIKALETCQN